MRNFCSVLAGIVTLLPAVIAYFLVARAILDQNQSDLRYAVALLIIFALSVMVSGRWMPEGQSLSLTGHAWRWTLLGGPAFLIYPMTVVVLIFGQVDMAAFVFHLVFGMDGTPWVDFAPYLVTAAVFWVVFCLSIWRARVWIDVTRVGWPAIAAAVLAINPLVYDLGTARVAAQFMDQPTLVSEFRDPRVLNIDARPNLIVLYLEGFERGYLHNPALASHAPELAALQADHLTLDDVHQIFGTGWSLSGNVATQCGVPVLPLGARPLDQMSEIKNILPEVTCLGDVLAAKGYDQTYVSTTKILGNKMGYYGFDNFYATHQYDTIIDRDMIVAAKDSKAPRSEDTEGWGVYDGEMFDFVLDYIAEKDSHGTPFSVVMATMDTHGPEAKISPQCTADGAGGASNDMRDALACTSRMVTRFLIDLAGRIDMDNTRIVIMSDHLAHHNNLTSLLNADPRRNFVMLLNGPDAQRARAPAAMIDVYPTILDWMGFLPSDAPYAGLGVSLLADEPTLTERLGAEEIDARLRVDVELARFIWQ